MQGTGLSVALDKNMIETQAQNKSAYDSKEGTKTVMAIKRHG